VEQRYPIGGLLILATEAGSEARLLMGSLRSLALPRRRKPAKGGMEALAGQIRRPKVGRRPKQIRTALGLRVSDFKAIW
jgi:hypothetical protein